MFRRRTNTRSITVSSSSSGTFCSGPSIYRRKTDRSFRRSGLVTPADFPMNRITRSSYSCRSGSTGRCPGSSALRRCRRADLGFAPGYQHRHARFIAAVLVAEEPDEIALLKLDGDEDVRGGDGGEEKM